MTDHDSRGSSAAHAGLAHGPAACSTLATDLDGTLIPLEEDPQGAQHQALREIAHRAARGDVELVFVTGRHRESVWQVAAERQLPRPSWLICDVGTTLLSAAKESVAPNSGSTRSGSTSSGSRSSGALSSGSRSLGSTSSGADDSTALEFTSAADDYRPVLAYEQHLGQQCQQVLAAEVAERLPTRAGLTQQEPEKQGRYKLSFYCAAQQLEAHSAWLTDWIDRQSLAYQLVSSVDPFNQDGLIDLLPRGCDKAAALQWWLQYTGRSVNSLVYAGDSGNDLAALTGHFRAIVVGNAAPALVAQVQAVHASRGTLEQLYVAQAAATAGVLEGCRWFQLL